MKKSAVLFVATVVLFSAVLAGCPPFPHGGHPPKPPHPPVPHHR